MSDLWEQARLRLEIVRLRRDLEIWRRNGGDILQQAEIDRLRALNAELAEALQPYNEAADEIERLKALLEERDAAIYDLKHRFDL